MSVTTAGIRAPLASIAFRRYLMGQVPSVTCSWAQVVAVSWVALLLAPQALGWVVALQFLPGPEFVKANEASAS